MRSPITTRSEVSPRTGSEGPSVWQVHDAFLTHDWGTDREGRNNHTRVARVNAALQRAGLRTWFDEEKMRGDIHARMAEGIDGVR